MKLAHILLVFSSALVTDFSYSPIDGVFSAGQKRTTHATFKYSAGATHNYDLALSRLGVVRVLESKAPTKATRKLCGLIEMNDSFDGCNRRINLKPGVVARTDGSFGKRIFFSDLPVMRAHCIAIQLWSNAVLAMKNVEIYSFQFNLGDIYRYGLANFFTQMKNATER